MKKDMRRKGSEKEQRSPRRRKRNHQKLSPTTQAVATIPDSETNFPNRGIQGEPQPEYGEQTSDVPSMTQSGGPQGTAGAKALTSESIAELWEEGQDLDSELVQDVENAGEADQGEIETHEASWEEAPEYRSRNRM